MYREAYYSAIKQLVGSKPQPITQDFVLMGQPLSCAEDLLQGQSTAPIEERVAMRIAVQSTSVGSNNGDDISYLTERLS